MPDNRTVAEELLAAFLECLQAIDELVESEEPTEDNVGTERYPCWVRLHKARHIARRAISRAVAERN